MRISIHHLALIAVSLALASSSTSTAIESTSTTNESSTPTAAASVDDKRNLSGSIVGEAFKLKKGKNADVVVSNAPSVAEAAAAIKSEQLANDEQKEVPMRIPDQDAQIGCPNIHGRYTPNLPMRRGKSTGSVINNAMEATELIKNAVEAAIRQDSASSKEDLASSKLNATSKEDPVKSKLKDTADKSKDDVKDDVKSKDIYGGPNGPFGLTNLGIKDDQETNSGAILPGVPAGLGRMMAVPNQSIVAKMFDEIRSSTEASSATSSAASSTLDSIRSVPTVDIPGFEPGKPLKIPGITGTVDESNNSSNGKPTAINSTIVQTVMATVTVTTMPPDVAALKQAHSKWDFF